ncbi:MAG: glycosyltransferase [Chloroflexota bacterium]
MAGLRVLVVTNMYPTVDMPAFGTFVHDQVAALRRAGTEVDVLFINGRRSKWNYIWALPRLWHALRQRHYDVIHAHYVLSGVVARAQLGTKLVLTHHGCEVLGYPRWQTWLAHATTGLPDLIIYTAERMRRALKDSDGWVIPCGVDLERFAPRPRAEVRRELGLKLDRPLVLWAGEHWRPEKRFWLAEQTMEQLKRHVPEAELILLSGKPHAVVPLYMNACDALLLTSWLEGSPMVVKEAMACNLPIVSVDVGDVAEVIAGTPPCSLAEPDPQQLALKLAAILRDPCRTTGRQRMGHLDHDGIAHRILQAYAQALSPRGARLRCGQRPAGS